MRACGYVFAGKFVSGIVVVFVRAPACASACACVRVCVCACVRVCVCVCMYAQIDR